MKKLYVDLTFREALDEGSMVILNTLFPGATVANTKPRIRAPHGYVKLPVDRADAYDTSLTNVAEKYFEHDPAISACLNNMSIVAMQPIVCKMDFSLKTTLFRRLSDNGSPLYLDLYFIEDAVNPDGKALLERNRTEDLHVFTMIGSDGRALAKRWTRNGQYIQNRFRQVIADYLKVDNALPHQSKRTTILQIQSKLDQEYDFQLWLTVKDLIRLYQSGIDLRLVIESIDYRTLQS